MKYRMLKITATLPRLTSSSVRELDEARAFLLLQGIRQQWREMPIKRYSMVSQQVAGNHEGLLTERIRMAMMLNDLKRKRKQPPEGGYFPENDGNSIVAQMEEIVKQARRNYDTE